MSRAKNRNIVIIGGGVAGLSAAIYAMENGFTPVILEKNRYIGGRVRSFFAKDIGYTIDNGQHILAAAYEETISLLEIIGSLDKIAFQKNFETRFLRDAEDDILFRSALLPSPLHFIVPLIKHRQFTRIGLKNYWQLFKYFITPETEALIELTVSQWLKKYKQSQEIIELLWHPLCLSIMNTPPETASATLLLNAVHRSFLGPRKLSGLGIPLDWLSEIFADPADRHLKEKGAEIQLLSIVQKIKRAGNEQFTVYTQKKTYDTSWIISTIPPYALKNILQNSELTELSPLLETLEQFDYLPIMTINIWLTRELPGYFPASIVSSSFQWIFKHPQTGSDKNRMGYTLVISAADQWIELSNEEVIQTVSRELSRLFGSAFQGESQISVYKIIKEKRATISQTPRINKIRPSNSTPIPNFKLAGDWTNTGLPATIEGAILSGRLAVEEIAGSD